VSSWKEWQKKLDGLATRARTHRQGPILLIDTGTWPLEDRLAYRDGSEAEQRALEERHVGPLPSHPDPLSIVAIVIVSPIGPPDDDDEERAT